MSMMMEERPDPNARYGTCPRCGNDTLRLDRPALNALSRTDNETYVCSSCGTDEGLQAMASGVALHSKDAWRAPEAATHFMSDKTAH